MTKYCFPATGSGIIRQSCSCPQTTRLILSSNIPSGTASCGPRLTLPRDYNIALDLLKRETYRFWCSRRILNQSCLSLGMYILTRLLRSSKCILASLTFPIPYKPSRVRPLRRRTGLTAMPVDCASASEVGRSIFPM